MSLARGAGILCGNPDFRAFLSDALNDTIDTPQKAAEAVRCICQVKSRAELNHNREAATIWRNLVTEFNRLKGK